MYSEQTWSNDRTSLAKVAQELRNHRALREALQQSADPGAVLMTNPGDLGDGLVAYGLFSLLDDMGLSPRPARDLPSDLTGKHTLVFGGGTLIEGSKSDPAGAIRPFLESGGRVILLPCSIDGYEDLFRAYPRQLEIFVREVVSYERLARLGLPKDRLHLCHDLGFAGDIARLLPSQGGGPGGVIQCFRTGASSRSGLPPDNVDIARAGGSHRHWLSRLSCEMALRPAVQLFSQFDTVETDRLHMAVLGTMLKKHVRLYTEPYRENLGVYEYSMREFDNLERVGRRDAPVPGAARALPAGASDGNEGLNGGNRPSPDHQPSRPEEDPEPEHLRDKEYASEIARLTEALRALEQDNRRLADELASVRARSRTATQRDRQAILFYTTELYHVTDLLRARQAEVESLKAEKETWYEPELARLQSTVAELDAVSTHLQTTKTAWWEPELIRRQDEIDRLNGALSALETTKAEWWDPELTRRQDEIDRLNEILTAFETTKTAWWEPELARRQDEIARLSETLSALETRQAAWWEPELARLEQRCSDLDRKLSAATRFEDMVPRLVDELVEINAAGRFAIGANLFRPGKRRFNRVEVIRRASVLRMLLESTGLFDAEWYRSRFMATSDSDEAPMEHYLRVGLGSGFAPSQHFCPEAYLADHPDLAGSDLPPIVHFLAYGLRERRRFRGRDASRDASSATA